MLCYHIPSGGPCRCGHKAEDSVLALGVDDSVLEASRMTETMLGAATAQHGGAVVRGFAAMHAALRTLAEPMPAAGSPTASGDAGARPTNAPESQHWRCTPATRRDGRATRVQSRRRRAGWPARGERRTALSRDLSYNEGI